MKRLITLIAILLPLATTAQQLSNVNKITADDGLSQNLVFDILQDQKGFIWIATKDGLNRYDGYDFKIYRPNPADNHSLSGGYVTFLTEDEDHNLWIETRPGGLHIYNPEEDNFTVVNREFSIPPGFENTIVHDLYGNSKTGWWVATISGLYHIDQEEKRVEKIDLNEEEDVSVKVVVPDYKNRSLIIGVNEKGFYNLDLAADSETVNTADFLHRFFQPDKTIDHLSKTGEGNWLMIQESIISEISEEGSLITQYDTAEGRNLEFPLIVSIQPDGDGIYWMVQNSDVIKLDLKNRSLEKPLDIDLAHSLVMDRSGVVWTGTSGNGLFRYDPKSSRFGYREETLFDWIAPDFAEKIEEKYQLGYQPIDHQIFTIIADSNEVYWILTLSSGLFRYDSKSKELDRHIIILPTLGEEIYNAYWAEKDENGYFTLLFKWWVVRYHPEKGLQEYWDIYQFFPEADLTQGAPLYEPYNVITKHNGYYWVGSSEYGLAGYNPVTDSLKRFAYEQNNDQSLSSNHILSLMPDPAQPNRYLWAGTDGGGLNRIDVESGTVLRFTESEGLPSNVVYSLYSDKSGNAWMSTNRGIVRFNTESYETLNFVKSDGLQSNEFNRRQHTLLPNGNIAFCGNEGCNLFNPDSIQLNRVAPKVVFTDVSVMNSSVLPYNSKWFNNTGEHRSLEVEWSQNIIGFEFAALEYSAPDKNTYRYRFPPFIEEWTEIESRRDITFTNLDPGNYRLEVMGSNNDGIWSAEPAVMSVVVNPPFWMTSWFRILALILFSGLIAGIAVYLSKQKYRRKLREMEYKMMVDQERLRISRDMHDDLGSRLTQIKLMSQLAESDQSVSEKLKEKLVEISDEAEEVILNFSEIVWALNPKNDTLYNLSGFMVQYAENFCRKVNIPCRIHAATQFPKTPVPSDVRHNLISIFKESLNNAAKHSSCTEIHVELALDNDHFIVQVRDNGRGFDPESLPATGQGLGTMKSRIEKIRGFFNIEAAPNCGTSIKVSWPIIST